MKRYRSTYESRVAQDVENRKSVLFVGRALYVQSNDEPLDLSGVSGDFCDYLGQQMVAEARHDPLFELTPPDWDYAGIIRSADTRLPNYSGLVVDTRLKVSLSCEEDELALVNLAKSRRAIFGRLKQVIDFVIDPKRCPAVTSDSADSQSDYMQINMTKLASLTIGSPPRD